jgi:4-amino-4-deoxy-L-arabinose transferase-like glycosyltransferase
MWVPRHIWEGRFGILLVLAFYIIVWAAIFDFCRSADWRTAALCGIALGISANFRPTGHYLIYVLPVLLPIIALVMKRRSVALSYFKKDVVGACLDWVLVLPWMLHLNGAGESFSLTNYMGKFNWMNDFRAMLADTEN